MNFTRRIFLVFFSLALCLNALPQTDTCGLRISLLTCSPGEDLYSLFGHSGLRVTDINNRTDIVYNYGTFDFDDPGFYLKFTKGKLLYYVAAEEINHFLYGYQLEKRGVIEQILQLSCDDARALYRALQENAREENKYYLYQFLFDNCTTRLRDMIASHTGDSLQFRNILPTHPPTFRNMLHQYLDRGAQHWSKFGIDILLGSRIDRQVTNMESMFLPDYLLKGFDSSRYRGAALVAQKRILLPEGGSFGEPGGTERQPSVHLPELPNSPSYANDANSQASSSLTGTLLRPFSVTLILLITGTLLSFAKSRQARNILFYFDVVFFLALGSLGLLLLFMWLGTDHELCADNYNLLWALPVFFPVAFMLRKKWVRYYFLGAAVWYLVLLLAWAWLPQGMNIACLPLSILAGIRCACRAWNKNGTVIS